MTSSSSLVKWMPLSLNSDIPKNPPSSFWKLLFHSRTNFVTQYEGHEKKRLICRREDEQLDGTCWSLFCFQLRFNKNLLADSQSTNCVWVRSFLFSSLKFLLRFLVYHCDHLDHLDHLYHVDQLDHMDHIDQVNPVQSSIVNYSPAQPSTAQYSPVQFTTTQYSPVQSITAQHSTIQPSATQHSTVQPSTF